MLELTITVAAKDTNVLEGTKLNLTRRGERAVHNRAICCRLNLAVCFGSWVDI